MESKSSIANSDSVGLFLTLMGLFLALFCKNSFIINVAIAILGASSFYLFGLKNRLLPLMPSLKNYDITDFAGLNRYILTHLSTKIFMGSILFSLLPVLISSVKKGIIIFPIIVTSIILYLFVKSTSLIDKYYFERMEDKDSIAKSLVRTKNDVRKDFNDLERVFVVLSIFAVDGIILLISLLSLLLSKNKNYLDKVNYYTTNTIKTCMPEDHVLTISLQGFAGSTLITLLMFNVGFYDNYQTIALQWALFIIPIGYIIIYISCFASSLSSKPIYFLRIIHVYDVFVIILSLTISIMILNHVVPNPFFDRIKPIIDGLRLEKHPSWEFSYNTMLKNYEAMFYYWGGILPLAISGIPFTNFARGAYFKGWFKTSSALSVFRNFSFSFVVITGLSFLWHDLVISTTILLKDILSHQEYVPILRRIIFMIIPWFMIAVEIVGLLAFIGVSINMSLKPEMLVETSNNTNRTLFFIIAISIFILPLWIILQTILATLKLVV